MQPAAATTETPSNLQASRFRLYDFFVAVFVVVLVISNLVGQKICSWGSFELFGWTISPKFSGAELLFPIAYILGDIFTEVYGYAASRRAIWLGFFASALMSGMGALVVALPSAPEFTEQKAFETVFGVVPRFVLASLVAYLCGEFANSYTLAKIKLLTNGRYLWMRTISSTVVGQLVDTTILILIAFGGRASTATMLNLILSGYFAKVAYEAAATPLTYWVVNTVKRKEGIDVFDRNTNFSPFHLG